jgi:hypothetical protein
MSNQEAMPCSVQGWAARAQRKDNKWQGIAGQAEQLRTETSASCLHRGTMADNGCNQNAAAQLQAFQA